MSKNTIYLTFDDGPNPEITPFVLDELHKRNLKATFFCVGENVLKYPEIFERIQLEGHQVGNHSFKHENANKVTAENYLNSIQKADALIQSNIFRPPYGRLSPRLAREISKKYKIIMWTWLSYDYDKEVSVQEILAKAEKQIKGGDILVLHDNAKIAEKQKELLPQFLDMLQQKACKFEVIH
jgi:peptidoglycan/xylan/chitin deacetylase (PgdA/CDA1 family)